MKKLASIAALIILCHACGSIKHVPVESVKTEYRDKLVRDSIYCLDSVFVKEKGDTLILERYRYLYRDRITTDSILTTDTIRVPYPVEVERKVKKPLTGWQNFQLWSGRIALVCGLFAVVYLIYKKKKKLII
ncbi:hypothetical protein LJC68_10560 [Bacteroidales bacterium OttesenSCG-928-B11]|nr:hypothetical protein [Bacteroidales bacterium OttesenSCG-928-B11]